MPKLMKYVVNIPEYIHSPTPEEKEMAIIKPDDWEKLYNKQQGYKSSTESNSVAVF